MAPRAPPSTAAPLVPERASLAALRRAAASCTACPLWKRGTQTVFGAGSPRARVLFVGEQPGNEEDLAGKRVVAPAGYARLAPNFKRRAVLESVATEHVRVRRRTGAGTTLFSVQPRSARATFRGPPRSAAFPRAASLNRNREGERERES